MTTPHTITCLPSEYWWGLATNHGHNMPFADGVSIELRGDCQGNQASPVLLSSAGRWLWSPEPFLFRRSGDTLVLEGPGPWHEGRQSGGLRAAYLDAASQFFPASGALCDPSLFLSPQYNTWIELGYGPSQERILAYADTLLAQGYPPGVLMIDDGWMRAYGDWDFTAERFPDAKGMIERLHKLGFKVMIWLIPFISPDSPNYRQLRREKGLVTGPSGKPVLREWWNGTSALVDVTGGPGRAWFSAQMKRLRDTYGIDGFKLDGGDTCFHAADDITFSGTGPNGHTESFASLALDWPLNEFRAAWKNGGQPFAQRLRDKNHAWVTEGLAWLVPHAIAAGLLGHIFVCPDMIGGGEIDHFHSRRDNLDAELFVRYAQCSALMPMMQFSAAPWRLLAARHNQLCLAAARLHLAWGSRILELAREAARTGEPMLRSLAYQYPNSGYETTSDQFLLGSDLLVAPCVKPGQASRTVVLPPGAWRDDEDSLHQGPLQIEVSTPLERLPHFIREV